MAVPLRRASEESGRASGFRDRWFQQFTAIVSPSAMPFEITSRTRGSDDSRGLRDAKDKTRCQIAEHTGDRAGDDEFDQRGRRDAAPGERGTDQDRRVDDVDQVGAARE